MDVVHGDGYDGHAEGAPHDRVIATAGVRHLPYAWVAQTRPGGLVVAPWGTHFGNGDAVARLVVAGDGRSASGGFTGPVEFMKLRAQRLPLVVHTDYVPDSVTDLDAVDGSPVYDLAPYFREMGPRGTVRQPGRPGEMLAEYWAEPAG